MRSPPCNHFIPCTRHFHSDGSRAKECTLTVVYVKTCRPEAQEKGIPRFWESEVSLLFERGGEIHYLNVFYCSSVVLSSEMYSRIGYLTIG